MHVCMCALSSECMCACGCGCVVMHAYSHVFCVNKQRRGEDRKEVVR